MGHSSTNERKVSLSFITCIIIIIFLVGVGVGETHHPTNVGKTKKNNEKWRRDADSRNRSGPGVLIPAIQAMKEKI